MRGHFLKGSCTGDVVLASGLDVLTTSPDVDFSGAMNRTNHVNT